MNRFTWISAALAAVMVLLAALGALCGAVGTLAGDEFFYGGMSRMAVMDTLGAADAPDVSAQITAAIGLTDAEQDAFAGEIAAFMRGETEAQPEVLNEKEQQHMRDVRRLVQLAGKVSQGCMTAAAGLAVVIAWLRMKAGRRGLFIGAGVGALLLGAIALGGAAMMNAQGFEALFLRFHELAFANDLWLMNPETDILIRMMPQLLFERAGMEAVRLALRSFAVTMAMLLAVAVIVGGMIRRQLSRGAQEEKQA